MHNLKHRGASIAHYQIIRRMGAQPAAQAVGVPQLPAGPVVFTSTVMQGLVSALTLHRSSAPPGHVQEPPRPMAPPRWRWDSMLDVPGAEGGAA